MEVARKMVGFTGAELGMNTELCLGLPGGGGGGGESEPIKINGKRVFSEIVDLKLKLQSNNESDLNELNAKEKAPMLPPKDQLLKSPPPSKAQVVGWPPVRSFRKNMMASQMKSDAAEEASSGGAAAFVKVSMDGAPYLRKVDLKMYKSYEQLSDALAKMFCSFISCMQGNDILKRSSEYVPSYEDKDGDWMLVGDVPWEMFVDSCKRLRIMKGSEAVGLAPRAMEKCKSRC